MGCASPRQSASTIWPATRGSGWSAGIGIGGADIVVERPALQVAGDLLALSADPGALGFAGGSGGDVAEEGGKVDAARAGFGCEDVADLIVEADGERDAHDELRI